MKKVLYILAPTSNAVNYYRILLPFHTLKGNGEVEVFCTTTDYIPVTLNFDIVHFNAYLLQNAGFRELIDKYTNIKWVCDIDDYWVVPSTIPEYQMYTVGNYIQYLNKMAAITTTTHLFAKKLLKYNSNVYVTPNAVDYSQEQYQDITQTPSNRLRFGIIGGVTHYYDIYSQMKGFTRFLKNELKNDIQIVLGGFNAVGFKNPINSQWGAIEQLVTDDYRFVDGKHKKHLMSLDESDYLLDKPYNRIYTLDVDKYMNAYRQVDVLLAPLANNNFNYYKSELKCIEAGVAGIPIICSNIGAYSTFSDDTVLATNSGAKNWADNIKLLLNEPEYRKELALNLHMDIDKRYNIHEINKKRIKMYKEI